MTVFPHQSILCSILFNVSKLNYTSLSSHGWAFRFSPVVQHNEHLISKSVHRKYDFHIIKNAARWRGKRPPGYAASCSVCAQGQASFQQHLCLWFAVITLKPITWGKTWGKGLEANKPWHVCLKIHFYCIYLFLSVWIKAGKIWPKILWTIHENSVWAIRKVIEFLQ